VNQSAGEWASWLRNSSPKEKIVERNQHDPIRQTDNADEQQPDKYTANNVAGQRRAVLLGLRLAQRVELMRRRSPPPRLIHRTSN
jgi:hypothetical protein